MINVELHCIDLIAGLEVRYFKLSTNTIQMSSREGGLMFWASVVDNKIKTDDSVKINAENYCKFLNDMFLYGTNHNQGALN